MPTHFEGTDEERLALDVFIKLMRAAQSVGDRTSPPVHEAGLTPGQFGVLETLYHLGPMLASQIAAKHLKSRNNLTTVIDNLEKRGLVRRERVEGDRRAILVHLTEPGRTMIQEIFPRYAHGLVEDMKTLSPGEQRQLSDLLRRLGRGTRTPCGASGGERARRATPPDD